MIVSPENPVGPFNEGQELRLLCESGGGKPIPRVTWYNGTEIISGKIELLSFLSTKVFRKWESTLPLFLGSGDHLFFFLYLFLSSGEGKQCKCAPPFPFFSPSALCFVKGLQGLHIHL